MKKFIKEADFSTNWKEIYALIKLIGIDITNNEIDKYAYSLYDRALYIYDSYVLIEKTNNVSVCHILMRSLYEIKVKSSKYQDDKDLEIHNSNIEIKREIKRFLKKVEEGKSFTAQILRKTLNTRDIKVEVAPKESLNKRKTIKSNFDDGDLSFDYEILYWINSLFVHSNSLSLAIEHKESYPENKIFNTLSGITRNMDMLNLSTIGTLLWITTYLFEEILSDETTNLINELWKKNINTLFKNQNINWEIDSNIGLGTMKIINEDGITTELKRQQRK